MRHNQVTLNEWQCSITSQIDHIISYFELEARAEKLRGRIDRPTQDLSDFLADLRLHNAGVLRIDPGNMFVRKIV